MLYMKFGMNSLDRISEKISDRELKYSDTIILGDNSSGKSLLLKKIIKMAGDTDAVYFIDAVNRGFDISKVLKENRKLDYKKTIVNTRIQEEYFNLKDSFNCFGTLTERIEQIYYPFEEKLQELFELLTGESFRIVDGSVLGEVEFRNGRGLLSSGFQAIVRILLELLFYQEKAVVEKTICQPLVIIDELDEFLSPGYAFKIFGFLKEKYSKMDFVVTTHSCDLVAGAIDCNLIVLDNADYEVMDVNDYQSVSEVQIIFDRLFGMHLPQTSETENILRRLLNNKMNQAWTKEDQTKLERLQAENLTASQQLICRQIVEW